MKEMLFNFVAYYQQVKSILLANKASSNSRQRELCMIPSPSDNFTQQTQTNIITQNQQFMQTSTNIQNNNFSATNAKSLSLTVSKVFSFMLVLLTFMFTSLGSSAQINYSQNFDVDAGSWTGVSRSTTAPCTGNALTINLYSSTTSATAASPLIGTSQGNSTTLTYKYKIINFDAPNGGTPNTFGNFKVQYSNLATGGTWTDISGSTVNNTNHTPSTSCATKSVTFTPPAGALYIRFVAAWSAGDYYWSLDDISLFEAVPCVPPSAQPSALVVNPTTGTTNSITGSFTASSPAATNYLVVRTATNVAPVPTNGTAYAVGSTAMGTGTEVISNSAVTTFTSTGLTAGTTYYYWVFSSSGNCVGEAYSYLSLASEVNATAPLTGSATTNVPVAPTCAAVTPASGSIGFSPYGTISWTGAIALPSITGYDVCFGTNQTLVENQDASVKILAATAATSATFTTALPYNTTYYWKVVSINANGTSAGCPVNTLVTSGPALPTCPTAFSPVTGFTNATATQAISWTASTNSAPAIAGYDLYVSSSFSAVQNQNPSARVMSNANATSFTPSATTILFAPNTNYYWMVISRNSFGPASSCVINSFTTASTTNITSKSTGGLWNDVNTWVGGVVPNYASNVTIADGAVVTVNAAVTVNSLTVGQGGSGTTSILQWNATANAMTVVTNLTIASNGRFLPYTAAATPAGQTLNIGGNFTNNGYTNLAPASALLNFNGAQQGGGSSNQTLGGTGIFEGDTTGGTRGIIRNLTFATNGSCVINTTQNLVAYTFSHAAGSLNTNGKLRIDVAPQVYGQPINRRVANVVVTAMGSGYTGAPVITPNGATAWAATTAFTLGQVRVSGSNVYVVLRAGTSGASAPSHTSDSATNGGTSLLWVGNTGTIGSVLVPNTAPAIGNQYFIGTKLFTMKGTISLSGAQTRDITIAANAISTLGTFAAINSDTLIYIGTAAQGTVNHDATTSTVRSISLTNQGEGYYTTAPTLGLLATNGGTSAAATAVFFQQIVGPANSSVTRGTAATITGGLDIVSRQSVTAVSTVGGGIRYVGTPLVGFQLPTGFQNLVTASGTGYTSAPTVAVTGGSTIRGFALPTFTVTVAGGKVVSVICSGAGSGFRTQPTLTLTGGGGTGATAAFPANSLAQATAVLANGTITKFNVTNGGAGYVSAPVPTIIDTVAAVSTVASALTSRVSLYNLSYAGFVTPATTNPIITMGSEVPANNRINVLTVGSTASIRSNAVVKMAANLELYAGSGALALPTSTSYGSLLDMNGFTLTCTHPGYGGTGTTGGIGTFARGYVANGLMKLSSPGGSQTRIFPFKSPIAIATGTGGSTTTATTGSTGSTITGVTVSETAKPTGTVAKFPIGSKAFKVDIAGTEVYGTAPTATLTYNVTDSLMPTLLQTSLFVGQSASLSGPWTIRSASGGTAVAISTGGNNGSRATGTTAPALIVPTSTDYYTWVSDATAPTITGSYGPYCSGGGTSVTINGTNFTNVSSVKFNGINAASFTVNSSTQITAITPSGTTAGTIVVTANGIPAASAAYTVTESPVFNPSISPANGLICLAGGSVSISLNDIGASSYTWTGATGLDTYTGLNVVASPSVSSVYTVTGTIDATGCVVSRTFNIGFIPSDAIAPTATPSSSCFVAGSTIALNSNLSAGNFSVASIPYAPATVPANVNNLFDRGNATSLLPQQNAASLGDDNGFINIPMGFNYNFFGTSFDRLAAGTNGTMMFGTIPGYGTADGELCDYTFPALNGVTFPNPNNAANVVSLLSSDQHVGPATATGVIGSTVSGSPNITITNSTQTLLAIGDSLTGTGIGIGAKIASIAGTTVTMTVNSTVTGTGVAITLYEKPSMRFWTEGTAPTRRFIMEYYGIRNFNVVAKRSFVQCMFYETTGVVEVHIAKMSDGTKTIGLQNNDKTIGATVPGRNGFTTGISTPESWRFTPPTNYSFVWSPSTGLDTATLTTVNYTPTTPGVKKINLQVTNPTTGCISQAPELSFTVNPTPTAPTVSGVLSVCGTGFTALTSSEPGSGNSINWYSDSLLTGLLQTGILYVTPTITQSTTYYAAQTSATCSSPGTKIVVEVTTPDALTVTKPVLCAGTTSTQLTVTSNTAPYDTYIWSPIANLFVDAALTIPYQGSNLTTVYAGNLNPGLTKYICSASSFSTLCSTKDSSMIYVQPSTPSVTSSPSFICVRGVSTLTVSGASAIAPKSVQWQSSTDNITFTDIAGADSTSYKTDTLTTGKYFRAIVKSGDSGTGINTTCTTTASYFLNVTNPQPLSYTNGNLCAVSGSVPMTATAAAGASFAWYISETSTTSLSTDATYAPIISASANYYLGVSQNGCEGTRVLVTATLSSPAPLTVTSAKIACNDGISKLEVTSTIGNYDSYVWSPSTALFTDSACTTAYTGVSATTVFVKSSTAQLLTYTVNASNSVSQCTNSVQTTVRVMPTITASTSNGTICVTGNATINLSPSTIYGNVQWQSSTDGLTYVNIVGETSTSFTAESITASTFYNALIKDDANNVCASLTTFITYSNPKADTLISATRCGAGTLTLSAQAATDSVKWYSNATGGSALTTGLSFTTPSISTSRTYYATFTSNGCQGARYPVTATTASASTIDVLASQTVCNDGVATLSVLSSLGNYTSYKWSPATNLFTDAAATVAYVDGANASTVYAKSSTAGLVTYQVVGINTTTTCTDTTTTDVIVMPASVTASATTTNLCVSGTSEISLSPSNGYGDGGIQWQISSNGSTGFTNISGATGTSLTTDTITSTQYYQAVVTNEAGATCLITTSIAINVNNPQPSAVSNGTRCGYGTVGLSVTATGTVNWYAAATGGASIATGTAFATPAINATTTYYVSVTESGCEGTRSAVTATVTSAPSLTLSSSTNTVNCDTATVRVNVTSTVADFSNYAWSPIANLYVDSALTIPYTVGTSVDTIYINSAVAGTTTYTLIATDTTTGCANIATTSVTVNVINPITVSPATFTACNDAVVALSITSDTTNYGTYTWSPVTNLYIDAAATTPYGAGVSATTVYAKSSTVGAVTYTVSGSSSGQACVGSATAQLFVLPTSGSIASNSGSFCRTGSSILTFSTSTSLPSGSIQWLSSADGITYAPISGATSTTYNTGTITATTYYRVQVRNGNGDACFAADYTQTINNPTVVSTTPATRCGKGTLTLGAVASSGATLSWYSVLTGGTVAGTGTSFVTPSISATKTYYVSAAIGSCVSAPRTAVVATIGTASAITSTVSQSLVCADAVATLSVTGTGYDTYKWSPATNLYTNSAATDAYVAGTSATTVYFKSSTPGTSSYVVTANNPATSCTITSSKDVSVQATSATISSSKSTGICNSGTAVLSLSASISLSSGSVQWESSSDDVTYAPIASATNATYTTATLTANKYYRALLKDGAGNICYTTTSYLQTVITPSVTATTTASRCGTGSVTLTATPDALSTIKWYTALTGGSSIASTSSFATPSISATTTYYVTAITGTCESTPRTAVTATVQSAPAITVTANQTVCNNSVTQLTALTGAAEYTSFTWTPAINLYGDIDATTGYTGGATVFVKRDTTGSKTYTLTAVNATTGCNTSATSAITVLPASVTDSMTAVSPICKTGTASMTLLPATASLYPAGSIQWKSSIDNVTFNNIIGAISATYSNATLDSTKYYYATISGAAGVCITTPTITYVVNNPKPTSVSTPLTRCGVGTVSLSATADSGVVKWYNNAGTLLDSGYTYTTGVISASTTYSAGLTLSGCEGTRSTVTVTVTAPPALSLTRATDTVCNGEITTLSVSAGTSANFDSYTWSPISNLFTDAGATVAYVAGTNFSTVYLKRTIPGTATYTVTGNNSTTNCSNAVNAVINVQPAAASIGGSPSSLCITGTSALTLVPSSGFSAGTIQWQSSGDSTVFTDISGATNASYGSAANTFTVFYRAIVKNRAGTTCFTADIFKLKYSNPALTTPTTEFVRCGAGTVTMTAQASVGDTIRWYANQNGGSALATGTTYVSPYILSSTTYYVAAENGACSTPRTAIVATTSTPPFLTVTSSQTVCNNQITPLSVTSNTADYTTYQWSPATNLFTDAAATTPYVLGGSATTVYARTSTAGSRTYTVNAVNVTAGCANSTTTTLSVQLATATISANPTTLCFNGTSVLTMSPTSPYGLGSIQWERSLDSITWLSSAGAVTTSYTTPLQADTRYYRAKVKDGAGNTCFTTAGFKLVANNPEITTTTPGTKCGTQPVTLSATATAGSTIKWYSAISGGTALFTGATFTTPTISATTNYYAEASVGTCVSPRIRVIATITPAPVITVTAAQIACDSSVKTIGVTSELSNFDSYVWTPVTFLYTDAAATVPYTTGTNASTVYFKRTTAGSTSYTVTGSNSVSTCVNTATTSVSRTVVGITSATASPASICNGTSSILNATSTLPDNTYSWTNGASNSTTAVSPTTIGSNTYTVTVTDPFTGCFETRAVEVTVKSVPAAPDASNSNQCGFGIPNAFVVSSGGTSGTFTWYSAPTAITTTYYNNDFSADLGTATITGNASLNAGGYVVLTPNSTNQLGGLTIDASGVNSDNYVVSFKLTTGGAGGADGMSYNFADDASATTTSPTAENGSGSKLIISFDDYGTAATATAPGIRVAYNKTTTTDIGITVGTNGLVGYSNNNAWVGLTNVPVLATINNQGKLNLTVNGTSIFSDLQLPAGYISANKSTWKHVFKARTGALSMLHAIDDVNIQYATSGQLSTGFNYPNAISETTNFYVSETVNGCEGPRVQVVASVTPADQINISANDSTVCVNSTVSLTANKAEGVNNYTYTWSATPSTGSGLTNGTTGSTVSVTPTAAGTYVYTALANDSTCNAIASLTINVSGFPVIDSVRAVASAVCNGDSSTLSVYSSGLSSGPQVMPTGYCAQAGSSLIDEQIFAFSFGSMVNAQTEDCSTNYTDYSSTIPAQTVTSGQSVSFSVTTDECNGATYFTNGMSIFIDYNRDGDYLDAGETAYTTTATTVSPNTRSGNIVIPANATPGLTKMRVVVIESTVSPTACQTYTYGETEEYAVNIIAGSNQNPALTYTWTPGGMTGFNVKVAPSTTTTYSVTATNATGCTTTSADVTVTVNPIPGIPSGGASEQCGVGIPTATVSPFNNDGLTHIFNWYTAEVGGTLVQTDTSITSTYQDTLFVSDTLYVSEISAFGCEGVRSPVYFLVNIPDVIAPSYAAESNCLGNTFTLSANQVQDLNTYNYTWTASPSAGSGITGSASGDGVVVTPTVSGIYTYILTAIDPDKGCTNIQSVSVEVTALPAITSVTISDDTICLGESITLAGTTNTVAPGNATLGTGTVVNGTTSYPTPFGQYYGSNHEQYLVRASELTALGLRAGNITSVAWNLGAGYTGAALQNFNIKMAHTSQTAMTSTLVNTGFTDVLPTATYTPAASAGYSTITFANPFNWDGTSNVVLDVSFLNCTVCNTTSTCSTNFTTNGVVNQTATAYVSTVNYHADGNCTINSFTPSNTGTTYSQRPNMRFRGQKVTVGAGSLTWTWSPGSVTGNPLTLQPTANTTYTVIATDANTGCSSLPSTELSVVVNPVPDVEAISVTPSTQCGTAVPAAYVSGSGGTLNWYSAQTGGTLLQSGGNTYASAISTTTSFWIAESNGLCETVRRELIATVSLPDTINATSSSAAACPGATITLNVANVSASPINNYSYSWTSLSGTAGALNDSTGTTVTVAPTTPGSYGYVVTANEASTNCSTTDTIFVTTNSLPVIDSVTTNASSICNGQSTTLSVYSNSLVTGPQTLPTGYAASSATSTSDDEIFNVTLNGTALNNTSTCTTVAPGANSVAAMYSNFTTGVPVPTINAGTTISGSVTIGQCLTTAYTTGYAVFVDLNRNGTFDTEDRVYSETNTTSAVAGTVKSFSFTMPSTATPGVTLMRIVAVESTGGASINPTGTYSWGETEDYKLNIIKGAVQNPLLTYTWTPGNLSGANLSVTPTTNTTYVVTATNPTTGCVSATDSISITVVNVGASASASAATVCSGSAVTLTATATGSGPFTYSWYNGSTVVGTTAVISNNPTSNTTYTVTVTDGCSNSTTADVTVNTIALPSAVITQTGTLEICSGTTQELTATTDATSPSYQWTLNGVNIGGATSSSYAATATGLYAVKVTEAESGCTSTSASTQVLVRSLPQAATFTPTNPSICLGDSISITGQSLQAASGTVGTQDTTMSNNGNPYRAGFGVGNQIKTQMLVKASELTTLGFSAGNITSLGFRTTAASGSLSNFSINMASSSVENLTTTFETPTFTQVFSAATLTPTVGVNTHTFSTPFAWDGTSNVIIQVCQTNSTSGTITVAGQKPGYVANVGIPGATACASTTGNAVQARPLISFGGNNNQAITWSPSAGLNTTSGNTVVAYPTETTVYTATATNTFGCTTTSNVTVTVRNPSTSTTNQTACNSFSWNGTNYTTSGVYTFNGTNAAGCDSVATLNLTINYSSSSTTTESACNSFLWNGITYTTSGVKTFTTTNAVGCDSVVTLNLTIRNSSSSTTTESACNSFSWNGTNYTTSGVYTFTTTNTVGCDSVATLNLNIRNSSSSSASQTACNSFSWNGTNYTTSGVYTFNGTNAAGCDSVATLNLTINNSSNTTLNISSCVSYLFNGNTYTTGGEYQYSTTNAAGCDSIVTLNLTIKSPTASSTTESACNSFLWNGSTYTASGVYTFTTTNSVSCDSVATLNLTIRNSSSSNTSDSICAAALPYVWNGANYTASGVYTFTSTNAVGCDSVATLNLTVNSCTTTLNVTAFLEGFYTGSGTMVANLYNLEISTDDTETDSVQVNLWSAANLSSATPDYSVTAVLHTNGTLTAVFPGATLNNSYYVALKHRNSIETWSAEPVTIASTSSYDFSTSLSSAFTDGFNDAMKSVSGGKYALYGGDVNQDGTIDLFDAQIAENGAANFLFGYDASDCNGDGTTDVFDLQLIDNNSTLFLFTARPF